VRLRALPPALTLSRGRRLSEGALVEARVRARLLGIPLLKIEALVVLVPTNPTSASSTSRAPLVDRASSSADRSRRLDAPGSALADAIRSIDEAGELLTQARNNGSG
jgi:hypothetical protein